MQKRALGLVVAALVATGTTIRDAGAATLVDDGSCPAGQIREVVGVSSKDPGAARIERLSQCISRKFNR